jgi:hypothetical protein
MEAPVIQSVKAKRGDLVVSETIQSYYALDSGSHSYVRYIVGKVVGVTREGRVKAVDCGTGQVSRGTPAGNIWLLDGRRIDMEALMAVLPPVWAQDWKTVDEVREWVRPFVRKDTP